MSSALAEELNIDAVRAARRLIGAELILSIGPSVQRYKIVETEAYKQDDPASHSFRGPTKRSAMMFGPAGRLYVYFTYGMHYCANIVTGPVGSGEAVLIRALEPPAGYVADTNGPAKLCRNLRIDLSLNGHDLTQPPLRLMLRQPLEDNLIACGPRIGIRQNIEQPWRFWLKDSRYVSRPSGRLHYVSAGDKLKR